MAHPFSFWKPVAGGGGTNNVTVPHFSGNNMNNTTDTIVFSGISTVTAGDSLLIGILGANVSGGLNFPTAGVTQSAGTATIGTVARDRHDPAGGALGLADAIFSVPITGSGTISMQVQASATCYMIGGVIEAHNLNATPFDTGNVNTGTSLTETTGTITTSVLGIIVNVNTESASGDFSRTPSNSGVFQVDTGSSDFTGCIQYKITTTNSNTLTNNLLGISAPAYQSAYAAYKTN